ncbi:hypothetical protein, partial [Bradyrhizobium sp. USDA 4508]
AALGDGCIPYKTQPPPRPEKLEPGRDDPPPIGMPARGGPSSQPACELFLTDRPQRRSLAGLLDLAGLDRQLVDLLREPFVQLVDDRPEVFRLRDSRIGSRKGNFNLILKMADALPQLVDLAHDALN